MSTQPVLDLPPTIPPPQTVITLLQQSGLETKMTGSAPGEIPSTPLHMSRSVLIASFNLSTSDAPGASLFVNDRLPFVPNIPGDSERLYFAYPQQFYFVHSLFWNAQVDYNFWAVKPPMAVGRCRVAYRPPPSDFVAINWDSNQRDIMKEWDLSESNIFSFSAQGYNLREFRSTRAIAHVNSLAFGNIKIPSHDYKVGAFMVALTNRYQPGGIFPENCNIYIFQSFANFQFKTLCGPPLIREESALTDLSYSSLNS